MSTPSPRVVIVGGGLSGLSLAYRIRERLPAVQLTILEKSARPGGNILTIDRDGFRVEGGPNGIFDAKPHTLQLCRDLGLADRLIPASETSRKHRYLFLDSRLRELPGSLRSFLTSPVLSWRAKASLLFEKYRKRPDEMIGDETVAAFARRRAGAEVTDILTDDRVTAHHDSEP